MTNATKQILETFQALTDEEREEVVSALMQQWWGVITDDELLTPELKAELDRRIEYLDAHPEDGISLEEASRLLSSRLQGLQG